MVKARSRRKKVTTVTWIERAYCTPAVPSTPVSRVRRAPRPAAGTRAARATGSDQHLLSSSTRAGRKDAAGKRQHQLVMLDGLIHDQRAVSRIEPVNLDILGEGFHSRFIRFHRPRRSSC